MALEFLVMGYEENTCTRYNLPAMRNITITLELYIAELLTKLLH